MLASPGDSYSVARRFMKKNPETGSAPCVAWQSDATRQAVSGKFPETRFHL
ncbi:hypothetical protein DEO72_LG6g1494 [Vigna unguiculata]|uniref:Uncharacterized protein n=1 Tax=Vigna unguiculata TaxID=3917 RepID=A0A4D6MAE4_VIGUN|nr:hypothetical protein DEO72_LG6g1493 [Vigna unguiculata]QCD96784.1 hypothetical protein DEO72_LG6g1494 [Vigna unguiculata]